MCCPQDDEELLMDFVHDQLAATPRALDLNYALRICTKCGRGRSCVRLYVALGMHREAVETAVKVGAVDTTDLDSCIFRMSLE